jgi:hypothetical protein
MQRSKIFLGLSLLTVLSACGSSGLFDRDRPDEFAVSRQPPLVIPPDFSLTPPKPGEARPQVGNTQQQTLEALFGGAAARSVAESAVVGQAGRADSSIRSSVGDIGTSTVDKGSVTQDIISAPEGDGQNAQASIPN